MAILERSAGVLAASFSMMFDRWLFTVLTDNPVFCAIVLLSCPMTTQERICFSRLVSLWRRPRKISCFAHSVLTNLCFNARDAMSKGGKLRLSLRNRKVAAEDGKWRIGCPSGDFVELSVSDTGIGIAPEHQERIFEPFFTTKKGAQGSGLGLATVYGIVQGARGDIAVESTPGRGCVFRVCFPRAEGVGRRRRIGWKPSPTAARKPFFWSRIKPCFARLR